VISEDYLSQKALLEKIDKEGMSVDEAMAEPVEA
jgi:hypothetical protein